MKRILFIVCTLTLFACGSSVEEKPDFEGSTTTRGSSRRTTSVAPACLASLKLVSVDSSGTSRTPSFINVGVSL